MLSHRDNKGILNLERRWKTKQKNKTKKQQQKGGVGHQTDFTDAIAPGAN